ncbi:hypothetical protein [Pseudorhodoferax sp. Leaf265]|uniref:hypothetical protein n=1 Tax=Pseudorhodoferax sp. Leaf265 TaxID=1736315 RepID=UPI0006F8C69C|nr:hypothetical protein [Pseudorhodoferax sp. Leaf265]KQP17039.1 hypothetical protein ASF45_27870 [Pseudorhodoferax sp. Leaf265]
MAVQVLKGVIKELGPAVVDTDDSGPYADVTYTYIEFEDGQMLRQVTVMAGLDGKLDNAFKDRQPVELHVFRMRKKYLLMLALKTHEGKIYATDISGNLVVQYAFAFFMTLAGFPLILLWGIGIAMIFMGGLQFRALSRVRKGRAYLRSLPNAITV